MFKSSGDWRADLAVMAILVVVVQTYHWLAEKWKAKDTPVQSDPEG